MSGIVTQEARVRRRPSAERSVALPTTSWSLLDAAGRSERGSEVAMAEFARRYYRPVQAYLEALTRDEQRAADLTQEFFRARVLNRRLLSSADRRIGGFRPYLKRAVRNFFLDDRRRDVRRKHAPNRAGVSIDAPDTHVADPRDASRPERAFHVAWVRSLLEEALIEVRARCEARRQEAHFDMFAGRYLSSEATPPSWSELGARFGGLDEKAARGRAETVARHFREVLRTKLGGRAGADEELAALRALLSRSEA